MKKIRIDLPEQHDYAAKRASIYDDGGVLFSDVYSDNIVILSREQFAVVAAAWESQGHKK